MQEVFIEVQANFHSSHNTGQNGHFTGNTGERAMPATTFPLDRPPFVGSDPRILILQQTPNLATIILA